MRGADVAQAVDGLAERVDYAPQHAAANGNVHDAAGRAAFVALDDECGLAEEHGADLVAVEVLGETVNRLPRIGALEFQELARHGVSQARDASDTIAHLVNLGDLLGIHDGAQGVEPSR